MVALTGSVVGISGVVANGVLATGVTTGQIAGVAIGLLNAAVTKGTTGAIVATSTGVGGAASAIFGSVAASKVGAVGATVVAGAAAASITGAATAAAVSSVCAGASGLISGTAAGILSGPIGWLVLGATEDKVPDVYTFDCWKPILHDDSSEPSNGKILREIAIDPRIKQVTTTINRDNPDLPYLVLENIWDEQFHIEYACLSSGQLAAHAIQH